MSGTKYAINAESQDGRYYFTEVVAADPQSAAAKAREEWGVSGHFLVSPAYGDQADLVLGWYSL